MFTRGYHDDACDWGSSNKFVDLPNENQLDFDGFINPQNTVCGFFNHLMPLQFEQQNKVFIHHDER